MSDYDPGSYNPGGNGCLSVPGLILAAMLAVCVLVMIGGDDTTTTNANAEVLSRNQVNLWSDVTNEYYNCYAAGSCVTSVTTTSSETTNSTNVDGDRNVVYAANGVRICPNPDNPNEWGDVAAWCEIADAQPQP